MADNRFDDDAFLALVTDPDSPVDAATAYAASVGDSDPESPLREAHSSLGWTVGMLIGLALFVLWLLW